MLQLWNATRVSANACIYAPGALGRGVGDGQSVRSWEGVDAFM